MFLEDIGITENAPYDYICGYDISSALRRHDESFANVDLIIFAGCNTAFGTDNLCTHSTIHDNDTIVGAACAIGFKAVIYSPAINNWIEAFLTYYSQGETVNSSLELACSAINYSPIYGYYGLDTATDYYRED